ncbi:YbfB/YjiJ family MFS transporter, partial [Escherichia coli]
LLAKAKPEQATRMNIVSVILTLICLALLAWLRSPLAIIILRGLAGVLSAVTLISASLWLLQHMKHHNGAPVLFAGVGMGIFLSAEFIAAGKALAFSSQQIWLLCAITATMLFLFALRGLLSPADSLLALNSRPATTMPSDNGRTSDA